MIETNKQAAEQERSGNYVDALFLWDKALYESFNTKQRQWCKARRDHCEKMASKFILEKVND